MIFVAASQTLTDYLELVSSSFNVISQQKQSLKDSKKAV